MKKAVLVNAHYTNDFEIDISRLNGCDGIYKLEVIVPISSTPLEVMDGSEQLIREDYKAFVLESTTPIVSGKLVFEFKEHEQLIQSHSKKIATVRYLFCDA